MIWFDSYLHSVADVRIFNSLKWISCAEGNCNILYHHWCESSLTPARTEKMKTSCNSFGRFPWSKSIKSKYLSGVFAEDSESAKKMKIPWVVPEILSPKVSIFLRARTKKAKFSCARTKRFPWSKSTKSKYLSGVFDELSESSKNLQIPWVVPEILAPKVFGCFPENNRRLLKTAWTPLIL